MIWKVSFQNRAVGISSRFITLVSFCEFSFGFQARANPGFVMFFRMALCLAMVAALAPCARADVRLAKIFADHVVLQRDLPVNVWGWAEPGESVTVKFDGQSVATVADAQGRWTAKLVPMKLNAVPQDLVVAGKNEVKVSDVLVGDVWLCSGQSNMPFSLGGADAEADIKSANFPSIRFLSYWEHFAAEPQADVTSASWKRVTPATAAGCAAVPFYFARKIFQETNVPIGLLVSAVGGTEIECWMPPAAFTDYPANADIGRRLQSAIKNYERAVPASVEAMEKWIVIAKQAVAEQRSVPAPPRFPLHPNLDRGGNWVRIQSLYNGMIHPLTPFAIKGAIWYQGENNGAEDESYFLKQKAMIETWRKLWGYDFPFYLVQLANYRPANDDPSGGAREWQYGRRAQFKCLSLPKTGMAVTIDVGEAGDIHPKNKLDVGERLAVWALAKDYGRADVVCSGPLYRGIKIDGAKIRVSFDSVGTGLMIGKKEGRKPAIEDKGGTLKRFAIAGEDKQWHWAEAVIDGETVVVSSPAVANPLAVRYAFSMNPEGCNLYNKNGLPASPFRTDDWPPK